MLKNRFKKLRQSVDKPIKKVKQDGLFSKIPLLNSSNWEKVIDFTILQKSGVDLNEVLKRL